MDVTVAVIPRERFRPLISSLESLFRSISTEVPVLVIEGGVDARIHRELLRLRQQRPFEIVSSEHFLLPNMARNLALDRVETAYVAFCDNDLAYSPGWLESLYANAQESGAAAVCPITLIGPSTPAKIHHAGGELTLLRDRSGALRFRREHRLGKSTLPEAEDAGLDRIDREHDYFEYHCVLVDRESMKAEGGHDERLIMHEHIDSSLRLRALGRRLSFEPSSRVMYSAFVPFVDEDWPYFLHRWSLARADCSNRVFSENWGIAERSGYAEVHINRAVSTLIPGFLRRIRSWRLRQRLLDYYKWRLARLDRREADPVDLRALEKPPTDALSRAGIDTAALQA